MSNTPSETERRLRIVERLQADTGIDDVVIEKLVHAFYARVRRDELLGPIFAARISEWDHHLQRLCDFWSSVVLMTGRYHGSPMQKHLPLPVEAGHFDRWLQMFRQTALEICNPKAAAVFIERAERIARSIEMGVASSHGVLLASDPRLVRATPEAAS
jgi:hemoglobin